MAVKLYRKNSARCTLEWRQKNASETFSVDDVVTIDGDGFIAKLTAGDRLYGQIKKAVAATDSDYASATKVPVLVCGDDAEFKIDISTGTAAQTDVGELIDWDDHNSADVDASTNDDILVTDIISTTQVLGKFVNKFKAVA